MIHNAHLFFFLEIKLLLLSLHVYVTLTLVVSHMYQFMNPYWVLVHLVEIIPSKQQKPFPNQSIKNS